MRIAILISGRGSNMQNIVEHFKNDKRLEIACVLSNNQSAQGITWASEQGLNTKIISHKNYPSRETFDQAMVDELQSLNVDYIILAGFMRILSEVFIHAFLGRILNIHPSILPNFIGLHTHQQALDAGVKVHGATVHFVTPSLDAGPIIAQTGLAVTKTTVIQNKSTNLKNLEPSKNLTPAEILANKVLQTEYVVYPKVIEWLLDDALAIISEQIEHPIEAFKDLFLNNKEIIIVHQQQTPQFIFFNNFNNFNE